jgi:protein-S-isoprenylcysteine O-methyltransferase Ste14
MSSTQIIIFLSGTILLILFSWFVSIREKRYHGIPRFFAFEGLLLLGLLQRSVWFKDPLVLRQIFSWMFLLASVYYVFFAVTIYFKYGKPGLNFENTSRLVTKGLYQYVRHPMYGSLLFLGWGMFLKDINSISITVSIIITIAVFLTCKVEEKEMIARFGDEYRDYMKKTRMWIAWLI